ncbi:interleukin-23 subunit alpha-like [Centroberyx affinis]|uniref:interleukin-23 subunit alpha-like n=1 Tax=Centroberyx affinis TaxID=166261 RepID=UPI003A5BFCD9
MYLDLPTIAAILLLLTPALSAPTGQSLQDACAEVQSSSLKLNKIAKVVSVKARNGSTDVTDFSRTLQWMEAKDSCDPGSLKQNAEPCIMKIFAVLKSYNSAIETVREFESCREFADTVKPELHRLHTDMERCVKSRGLNHQEESQISTQTKPVSPGQPVSDWEKPLLCQYTMDRLFSFSIFTARVFGLGDPAHHTGASADKCM